MCRGQCCGLNPLDEIFLFLPPQPATHTHTHTQDRGDLNKYDLFYFPFFFLGSQQFRVRGPADVTRIFRLHPKRQGHGTIVEKVHIQSDFSHGRHRPGVLQNSELSRTARIIRRRTINCTLPPAMPIVFDIRVCKLCFFFYVKIIFVFFFFVFKKSKKKGLENNEFSFFILFIYLFFFRDGL